MKNGFSKHVNVVCLHRQMEYAYHLEMERKEAHEQRK